MTVAPRLARWMGLALAWGCSDALAASAVPAATHCRADEQVQFSCQVGARTVSLCTGGETLSYRYGRIGRVELAFSSSGPPAPGFQGTVQALSPGAQVQQLWFDRGPYRYLLAVCSGGDCPHEAALAVLRGPRLLQHTACAADAGGQAWFGRGLVEFGPEPADSRSHHPALVLGAFDHPVDQVFNGRPTVPR